MSSECSHAKWEAYTKALDQIMERRFLLWVLITLILAGVLFFARLGARALWASEGRWAEVAREMVLTGNYLWPTINGRPYYDKPLLSYWFVVGTSELTGQVDEATTRLPSACAGLIAVAATILLARNFYRANVAVWSGLILATSFSFVFFSRHASADMETVAGELVALCLFLKASKKPQLPWLVTFWLVMAVTSLTKGLLGYVLPLVVAVVYSSVSSVENSDSAYLRNERSFGALLRIFVTRNRWFFNRYTPVAVGISLAFYLAPFMLSYLKTGSHLGIYMVYRENLVRFVKPFDHRGPVWLYVPVIFALMAPWSAFLLGALVSVPSLRKSADEPAEARGDLFTLSFFWSIFLFFTASGSRRSYYILPILPACAILVARSLTSPSDRLPAIARLLLAAAYWLIAVVTLAGVVALLPPSVLPGRLGSLPSLPHRPLFAIMWVIASSLVLMSLRAGHPRASLFSTFVSAYLALGFIFLFAMPGVEPFRPEADFARKVRATLLGDRTNVVAMYRMWAPGLDFYLDFATPVPEFSDPITLSKYAAQNCLKWVITRTKDVVSLPLRYSVVVQERSFPWESPDKLEGKFLLLRVTESGCDGTRR